VLAAERVIFIGDIQGCYDEWMSLLKEVDYKPERDQLILLGDMINRGPKNLEVMTHLMNHPEIKAVMGNHEYHFIRHVNRERKRKSFERLERELSGFTRKIVKYLKGLPMYLEGEDWIAVHGGLEPGKHPSKSSAKFLCTVREIGANGESRPWFDFYEGHKWILFGHWSLKGLVQKERIRGLDTGCVYGGRLTAWIYPEDKLVSVPAQRMHFDPRQD